MKRFLLQTLVFVVTLFIGLAILNIYILSNRNAYLIKREILETNLSTAEVLVLGSSHALFGVDPVHFNTNTLNLANVSQTLYYDLNIIEKYLNEMPELKTICLNLDYLSFRYYLENHPEQWRRNMYFYYWNIAPLLFDYAFYSDLINLPRIVIKNHLLKPSTIDSTGFQKMVSVDNFLQDKKGIRKRIRIYKRIWNKGTKERNIKVLERFFEISEEKDIQLVFFMTPKTIEYIDAFEPEIIDDFSQSLAHFKNKYNINIFDLSKDTRFSYQDFRDIDHLNYKGAEKFSKLFSKHLENNHLE